MNDKYTINRFGLGAQQRLFLVGAVKVSDLLSHARSRQYFDDQGDGEQRSLIEAHYKKLRNEMEADMFTPAPMVFAMPDEIEVDDNDTELELNLSDDDELLILDGQHRLEALNILVEDKDFGDKVKEMDVAIQINLNGNRQTDFVNLQKSRKVDAAHILSIKIKNGDFPKWQVEHIRTAHKLAKILSKDKVDSHLYRQIKFDSGLGNISLNTLLSRGSSDIATSMIGGARIASAGEKDENWLADVYTDTFKAINDDAFELLDQGKILCPIWDGGTKGGTTLMNGVANMVAYMMIEKDTDNIEDIKDVFLQAVRDTLDISNGKVSGPDKRQYMGDFAREFFSAYDKDDLHHGVPVALIKLLSASTFAVEPLPKPTKVESEPVADGTKRKPGRPKKEEEVVGVDA